MLAKETLERWKKTLAELSTLEDALFNVLMAIDDDYKPLISDYDDLYNYVLSARSGLQELIEYGERG